MLFSLTNTPASFQSLINNILRKYLGVFTIAYLNNILIYSKNKEEHIEYVRKVLQALNKWNLCIKPSKCEFHTQKTKFLGYIIKPGQITIDPAKVESIRDWPIPITVKQV
jgi:hypothetical protein